MRRPAAGLSTLALVLVALLLVALPALADDSPPPGGPVAGSSRTVYRAPVAVVAAPPAVPSKELWFDGSVTDQLSKVAGLGTARIVQAKPADEETVTQATVPGGDEDSIDDPSLAIWSGPFAGTVDGDVVLRTFWSSVNPLAAGNGAVVISFMADGGPDEEPVLIGRKSAQLTAGTQPALNVTKVRVRGTVARTLTVTVSATYVDASSDLRTTYGSAAYPAGLSIPRGAPVPTSRPGPEVIDRAPTLEVQAVDIGQRAVEPTLGVARSGTAFYGATDGSITRVMRSRDGGRTWEAVASDLAGGAEPPTSADPYLYLDEATGRLFTIDLYAGCSYLLFSDDEGATWQRNPALCGTPGNDHQSVVAGPVPDGMAKGSYGRLVWYCASQVIDAVCGRSDDGGQTMLPAGAPAFLGYDEEAGGLCAGFHGHIRTDSDGRMFVPKGHCNHPWVAVTDDGGASFRQVQVSRDVTAAGYHVNMAVDEADNVYVVWWDEPLRLPWMAVSRDHGATWGRPVMVAPPGVVEVNFPSIAAGAPGRVVITFPGTTQVVDTPHRPWNSYVVVTEDALAERPVFQSATANPPGDPIHRGPCQARCGNMLDFLDVVVSPGGEAWASVVDTCTVAASCTVNEDDPVPPGGVAQSQDGIAVRQVCGPALRGPVRSLAGAGCVADGSRTRSPAPHRPADRTLPRTGAGSALLGGGGGALLVALALLRLLGRSRGVDGRAA